MNCPKLVHSGIRLDAVFFPMDVCRNRLPRRGMRLIKQPHMNTWTVLLCSVPTAVHFVWRFSSALVSSSRVQNDRELSVAMCLSAGFFSFFYLFAADHDRPIVPPWVLPGTVVCRRHCLSCSKMERGRVPPSPLHKELQSSLETHSFYIGRFEAMRHRAHVHDLFKLFGSPKRLHHRVTLSGGSVRQMLKGFELRRRRHFRDSILHTSESVAAKQFLQFPCRSRYVLPYAC